MMNFKTFLIEGRKKVNVTYDTGNEYGYLARNNYKYSIASNKDNQLSKNRSQMSIRKAKEMVPGKTATKENTHHLTAIDPTLHDRGYAKDKTAYKGVLFPPDITSSSLKRLHRIFRKHNT